MIGKYSVKRDILATLPEKVGWQWRDRTELEEEGLWQLSVSACSVRPSGALAKIDKPTLFVYWRDTWVSERISTWRSQLPPVIGPELLKDILILSIFPFSPKQRAQQRGKPQKKRRADGVIPKQAEKAKGEVMWVWYRWQLLYWKGGSTCHKSPSWRTLSTCPDPTGALQRFKQ